jgi:hypothetical protein
MSVMPDEAIADHRLDDLGVTEKGMREMGDRKNARATHICWPS